MPFDARPKLAVFKFSSCDGCQLSLLNLEDELLSLVGEVEIAYFLEARSQILPGPYDVSLVEGSITTAEDEKRIEAVRKDSKYLITIGACATAGGIQALRNWQDVGEFTRAVYPTPAYIHTLEKSTPISAHVRVDFEVNGCPINKAQILEVIIQLLEGRALHLPNHSVCMDCKRRSTVCVMVARGLPCLGPLTRTGCGAICPAYHRGCYGCFGPLDAPNSDSWCAQVMKDGMQRADMVRLLRGFTGFQGAFRSASDKWEKAM
jgi:coenzyme F420-reducing hydrogenase gamma subunit